MPGSFTLDAMLALVRIDRMFCQPVDLTLEPPLQRQRQCMNGRSVDLPMNRETPSLKQECPHQEKEQRPCFAGRQEAESTGFSVLESTRAPSCNTGTTFTVLGVRQYLMSSPRFRLRNRRR